VQIVIALVVTAEGLPLPYEVLPGNTSDKTTLRGFLEPVTFRQVGSTEIGPKEWVELRELIHRITRDDPEVGGFVIAHGTATLEETAFFLNLTLASALPVVLVGAQRPASALGTDAGMNLVNALRVAGSSEARDKGVLGAQ
jgi:L-asparaginase